MAGSNPNLLPSQLSAALATISPGAQVAGTVSTPWLDMSQFEAVQALVMAGTLGAAATLDAKFEQASDAAGTGAKDVAGKAITQLTKAGGDDDKQSVINLFASELDIKNDFTHARLSMTVAVATSDTGAMVQGFHPHYGDASDNDAASVAEIVE